jgi:hypothetical protein
MEEKNLHETCTDTAFISMDGDASIIQKYLIHFTQ